MLAAAGIALVLLLVLTLRPMAPEHGVARAHPQGDRVHAAGFAGAGVPPVPVAAGRLLDETWRRMPGGDDVYERITLWETDTGARKRAVQRISLDRVAGEWSVLGEVRMAADRLVVARADDGADWEVIDRIAMEAGWRVRRASAGSHVARVVSNGAVSQNLAELERAKLGVAERLAGTGFSVDWPVLFNPAFTPDDPRYAEQWAWDHLGAEHAWAVNTGSEDVVVAVVDSGIDANHPELSPNIWSNPLEAPDGSDTSGSGFIDDVRGWNFAEGNADTGDPHGHGTAVAGIIGAVGNNGFGVAGAAWKVALMPLRVGQRNIAVEDIIDAIDYAVERRTTDGVNVVTIQLSLGANIPGKTRDEETPLFQAVRRARDAGILCVAAAGNDGRDNDALQGGEPNHYFPSDFDLENVISVAASTPGDTLRESSNRGAVSVDLAAPGEDILTTLPGGVFGTRHGTSFAAPHVTGLVVLASAWNPDLDAAALRRIVIDSGRAVDGLEGLLANAARVAYDDGHAEILRWPRVLPAPGWPEPAFLRSVDPEPLAVVVETGGHSLAAVSIEVGGGVYDAAAVPDGTWVLDWPPPGAGAFAWSVAANAEGSRSVSSPREPLQVLAPFDFWKAEQFGAGFETAAAEYETAGRLPGLGKRFFFGLELGGSGGQVLSGVPTGTVLPAGEIGEGDGFGLRFWQSKDALSMEVVVERTATLAPGGWEPAQILKSKDLDTDVPGNRVLRELRVDANGPRGFYRLRFEPEAE